MSQAIVTKYHGPTNTRGARVSATCDAGRVTIPWPYELGVSAAHCCACHELALKLDWRGHWVGGSVEKGYVFVNVDHASDVIEVRA